MNFLQRGIRHYELDGQGYDGALREALHNEQTTSATGSWMNPRVGRVQAQDKEGLSMLHTISRPTCSGPPIPGG